MSETRIRHLEETIAHQGRAIEELSEEVRRQGLVLDEMARALRAVRDRFEAVEAALPAPEITRPPHW